MINSAQEAKSILLWNAFRVNKIKTDIGLTVLATGSITPDTLERCKKKLREINEQSSEARKYLRNYRRR